LQHERARLLAAASSALGEPVVRARVRYELRYRGQSFELGIEQALHADAGSTLDLDAHAAFSPQQLCAAFADAHETRYGYREQAEVELVTMRASVWAAQPALRLLGGEGEPAPTRACTLRVEGEQMEGMLMSGAPAPGIALRGPTVCLMAESTLFVGPGWSGSVDEHGTVHLHDEAAHEHA
jgi:N-methylhydantoinase A